MEKEIQIIATNPNACDLKKYHEIHSSGEPISSVDFRLYQIALVENGGVSPSDARREIKQIKEKYNTCSRAERARLADVMGSAFMGLVGDRSLEKAIPVTAGSARETVVFGKK